MSAVSKAKKILICSAIFLIIFSSVADNIAVAKSYDLPISPGIEIIKNKSKLKKRVIKNQKLNFSPEEFKALLGDHAQHLTIASLPKRGELTFMGVKISEGTSISLGDIEEMIYIPEGSASLNDSFTFKNSSLSDASLLECIIDFSDSEMSHTTQTVKLCTYKDVAIYFDPVKLCGASDSSSYVFQKPSSHGLLSKKEALSVYYPNTKFCGNDTVKYQVFEKDRVIDVLLEIEVEKPHENIFFSNLINDPMHKSAIDFIRYGKAELFYKNENSFYFDKERLLNSDEAKALIKLALTSQKTSQEVWESGADEISLAIAEATDPQTGLLTAENCVKIFQSFN